MSVFADYANFRPASGIELALLRLSQVLAHLATVVVNLLIATRDTKVTVWGPNSLYST